MKHAIKTLALASGVITVLPARLSQAHAAIACRRLATSQLSSGAGDEKRRSKDVFILC